MLTCKTFGYRRLPSQAGSPRRRVDTSVKPADLDDEADPEGKN